MLVCTHTLYNEVWAGSLDLSVTELPEAMKRKQHKDSKPREHKKNFGTDISQRPEIAALRIEEGHWEGDTVVGKRAGKEAVVLSLLEKKTENYIAIRIPGKDADSVLNAMKLKEAAKKVEDGIEETLTYCDFPSEHWTRIRTNNVIERLNREIHRRTRVVGTFPDGNSALMLVCARLRHVAGTQWGCKKYMNMKHLEAVMDDASIAG